MFMNVNFGYKCNFTSCAQTPCGVTHANYGAESTLYAFMMLTSLRIHSTQGYWALYEHGLRHQISILDF